MHSYKRGVNMPLSSGNEINYKDYENFNLDDEIQLNNAQMILSMQGKVSDENTETADIPTSENFVLGDLKYNCVNFIVDTENTSGHFADNVGDPAEANPFIVAYTHIFINNKYYSIYSRASTGANADDIVLFNTDGTAITDLPTGTYPITRIIGAKVYDSYTPVLEDTENVIGLVQTGQSNIQTYTLDTNSPSDTKGYSIRQSIDGRNITFNGNSIRLKLKGGNNGLKCSHIAIVEREITGLDSYTLAKDGTGGYPTRALDSDINEYCLQFNGNGTGNYSTLVSPYYVSGSASDEYFIHIDLKGTTGDKVYLFCRYLDGSDFMVFNFTGANAETFTLNNSTPTSDQLYEITLTADDWTTYDVALPIILDTSGSFNCTFISENIIRAKGFTALLDDTGSTVFPNGNFIEWTLTANGTTTPTEVFFKNATSGCDIPAGGELTTEFCPFNTQIGKDYLVIFDIAGSPEYYLNFGTETDFTTYYKDASATYNTQNMTADSSNTDKIAILTGFATTNYLMPKEVYFSVMGDYDTIPYKADSLEVSDVVERVSTAGTAKVYYMLSTDKRTWLVYYDSSFQPTISNSNALTGQTEGVWCIRNPSTDVWSVSTANDRALTMSLALNVYNEYRMDKTALTTADFIGYSPNTPMYISQIFYAGANDDDAYINAYEFTLGLESNSQIPFSFETANTIQIESRGDTATPKTWYITNKFGDLSKLRIYYI
jgi:hypothetical protein